MKKISLKIALKFGIWLLVRRMRKEVEKAQKDPIKHQAYKEIANALLTICRNVALLYGINVKIKFIDPMIQNTKRTKRTEKTKRIRNRRMRRHMSKMKILLILLVAVFAICGCSKDAESVEAIAEKDVDWVVFSHFAIGAAWDLGTGEEHSIAFISILTYKELLNIDLGLIDFEDVQNSNDQWYENVSPGIGISADVIGLVEEYSGLGKLVEWIPDIIGIGIGAYLEIDSIDDMDVIPMIYITAQW